MGVCGSTHTGQNPLPIKEESEANENVEQIQKVEDQKLVENEVTETVVGSTTEDATAPTPEPEYEPSEEEEEEDDDPGTGSEFVFEIENAEDEVQISAANDDYPPPKPVNSYKQIQGTNVSWFSNWSPHMKDEIPSDLYDRLSLSGSRPVTTVTTRNVNLTLDQDDIAIQEVDKHARQTPRAASKSFSELIKYLTQNLQQSHQREMLTARAIIVWLSNQNVHDMAGGTGNQETPEGFLVLLGQKKTTYSTFFTVLCRIADITCVQISGIAKCGSYVPGDKDLSNLKCVWNAIYIDGNWKIVHPYWTCVSLFGHNPGGWIKFESGGQAIGKRLKSSVAVLRNALKDYYFMTNPKEFIYECHPNDEKWQLLENPVSRDEFIEMPYLLPTFFGLGLKLKSKPRCLLHSENGSLSIELEAPLKNANVLDMWYELFLNEGSSSTGAEDEMCTSENIPRLVTMIRNGDEWKFNIQFPVEGSYKLCLYGGPHKTQLLRVCEFRLDCERRKKNCLLLPFNPGIVGFGPGPTSEEAGLFVPSQRSGFISAKLKCEIKIIFHIDGYILHNRAVKCELINNESEERTRVKCDFIQKSKLLKLTTSILHDGDYSLTISTGTGNRFISADNDTDGYKNVCNYYISTTLDQSYEKTSQRLARKALEDVYEGDDIDKIQSAINRCIREKIYINDDQILAAVTRLELLKARKVLRDAYLRRNTDIAAKAMEFIQSSPYRDALKMEVNVLGKLKRRLEKMGTYTQRVPEIHESLQELEYKKEPKPEIYDTLLALFVVLGEPEESMTSWSDIARLVHPTGVNDQTALQKMKAIQEGRKGINIQQVRKADRLLHKNTIEDVRHTNMAAATIYQWTEIVIKMCFDVHEGSDDL